MHQPALFNSPIVSRRAARSGALMTAHIDHHALPAGERINFVLVAAMGVCLLLVMIAGTAGLVWNGKAPGDIAGSVADVFAWLFAAAFFDGIRARAVRAAPSCGPRRKSPAACPRF